MTNSDAWSFPRKTARCSIAAALLLEAHVSAIDTLKRSPIERLRALQAAAGMSAAAGIFRFTLGGWLFAYPAEKIWLAGPPESDGKMAGPRRDRELGLEITRAEAFTQRAVDRFVAIFGWSRHRR